MFKSSLTSVLYQDFLSSFNLKRDEVQSYPFVYVDPETGEVRLLTSMSFDNEGDLFANTMASHGGMEVLSTRE